MPRSSVGLPRGGEAYRASPSSQRAPAAAPSARVPIAAAEDGQRGPREWVGQLRERLRAARAEMLADELLVAGGVDREDFVRKDRQGRVLCARLDMQPAPALGEHRVDG